ncbi:MAG: XdhC family protein [Proteobacteria bacterium]|nr:XdhC family protein [Pseudomonadota bacterium]
MGAVETSFEPLLPLYRREREAGRALALGLLVDTVGSTYRKPGAPILIAADGTYAGLISGGCLEGDLREHALEVIASGVARTVRYELKGADDLLWGLGSGCEGAMQILLLHAGAANDWQPLAQLSHALDSQRPFAFAVVSDSSRRDLPLGTLALPDGGLVLPPAGAAGTPVRTLVAACQSAVTRAVTARAVTLSALEGATLLVLPLALPPRILVLGAGPDTMPVVQFAGLLHWHVTVVDHRASYLSAERFPAARHLLHCRPEELAHLLGPHRFAAAVVMSHHLASDRAYLAALARSDIPYVGLLGPPARRERLLSGLPPELSARLSQRLRAPVGLQLGGRAPESIALSIVAQLHAFVHGAQDSLGHASTESAPVGSRAQAV